MNRRIAQSVALILFGLMATSCVAIPIGGGEPQPFSNTRLSFITVGNTHKDEVIQELGEAEQHADGQWWLYHGKKKGTKWLVVAGGGYVADVSTMGGATTHYRLLIGFNVDGTVLQFGVLENDSSCDKRRRLCLEKDMIYLHRDLSSGADEDPHCVYTNIEGDEERYSCVYGPISPVSPARGGHN